jgi:amino acid adenylation domain-containing protein
MDDIAKRLAALSPENLALFRQRLRSRLKETAHDRITPRPRDGKPFPLSFAQERLWFFDRLQPGIPIYNLSTSTTIPGTLNVEALERALFEMVRRHESLRTTFDAADGQPVQVIAPPSRIPLSIVDLTSGFADEGQRLARAQELAAEESMRPFDLARGPLIRVTLFRLGVEHHWLLLAMHHIVSDGWSLGVLMQELSLLYEAYAKGQPSPLKELPMQYADFAVWQREWLSGETLERELRYWREQLADAPTVLELPADRPRPPAQSFRGAAQMLHVRLPLLRQLKTLAQQTGSSLFMVLLAVFKVLLARYTGQRDVLVGTPIANRNRAELESLIGFFVNTLALRTRIDGRQSFSQLLGQVREATLSAYAHQDLPFEKLVEELQPDRRLSHHPLVQVMFIMQNDPTLTRAARSTDGGGVSAQEVGTAGEGADAGVDDADAAGAPAVVHGLSKLDLALSFTETPAGLFGVLEYSTDLFDDLRISRMIGHYKRLLEAVVADPDKSVAELPMLGEDERRQLLVDWNRTQAAHERSGCVHEMFAARAAQNPRATAVIDGTQEISYAELNARANRLARHLLKRGVRPETRVCIMLDGRFETIVAILAVLKAGGAYVPLDPAYPAERLAFIMKDAAPAVAVTLSRYAGRLKEGDAGGLQVIAVDEDAAAIGREEDEDPPSRLDERNLAYIIYTSGSTGNPKGVMVEHGGLRNLAEAQARSFGVRPVDRVLQFASLSFDLSVFELSLALTAGATLCLGVRDVLLFGESLFEQLRAQEVSVAALPPTVLATLPEEDLTALRLLIVGGESCPPELIARWARGRRFFNAYGPTETTVWVTASEYGAENVLPPIGRPIINSQLYVLDACLQPVPVGIPGELHIGGLGVTRGYLNHPELTAERFIPHPFGAEPGARLYKTGDLVRYHADGQVEFLGRVDQQIKIRGYRLEPGEVEAAIKRMPGVREAVVVAREDVPGEKRLLAYFTAGSDVSVNELRRHVRDCLPEHMIPSAFVWLETLPLTPSGKVDRRALPAPDRVRPELENEYEPPRTPLEEELCGIWSKVLGLERIGVNDNFFALGGHSLLAVQVMSRVQEALQIEVPLRLLFEFPTVAQLSAAVEEMRSAGGGVQIEPLVPLPR